MKELTIDAARCPGVAVCATRACQTFLGVSFTDTLERQGYGLISYTNFCRHGSKIEKAIDQCPAAAISLQEHSG